MITKHQFIVGGLEVGTHKERQKRMTETVRDLPRPPSTEWVVFVWFPT